MCEDFSTIRNNKILYDTNLLKQIIYSKNILSLNIFSTYEPVNAFNYMSLCLEIYLVLIFIFSIHLILNNYVFYLSWFFNLIFIPSKINTKLSLKNIPLRITHIINMFELYHHKQIPYYNILLCLSLIEVYDFVFFTHFVHLKCIVFNYNIRYISYEMNLCMFNFGNRTIITNTKLIEIIYSKNLFTFYFYKYSKQMIINKYILLYLKLYEIFKFIFFLYPICFKYKNLKYNLCCSLENYLFISVLCLIYILNFRKRPINKVTFAFYTKITTMQIKIHLLLSIMMKLIMFFSSTQNTNLIYIKQKYRRG